MNELESKGGVSAAARDGVNEKRVYVAPRLRTLGSVRELTFGTSIGTVDSFHTRKTAGS